jgi:hypothetical protein
MKMIEQNERQRSNDDEVTRKKGVGTILSTREDLGTQSQRGSGCVNLVYQIWHGFMLEPHRLETRSWFRHGRGSAA